MRKVTATREALAAMLRETAEGFEHLGKLRAAAQALGALAKLEAGDAVVTAGHTEYRVEEIDPD